MAYQYLGSDPAQIQTDAMDAQRRQERAQQLMQAGLNPVQGGNNILALLASTLSTVRGANLQKEADAKWSDVIRRDLEAQNQADQAKAEAEQRRRDEDWQREIEKMRLGEQYKSQYSQRNIDPLSAEGLAAQAQLKKLTATGPGPSESDRKIAQLRALGATDEQIRAMLLGNAGGQQNIPSGYRPSQTGGLEPIPGGPADKPAEADPKAAAAQQAREILAQLEGSMGASGPLDQYLHPVDSQKFEKTVAQLVNPFQTLTRVPGQGAQSDKELATLMASFPATGNFDSTNKQQIENLRAYLDKLPAGQAAMGQQVPPPMGQQQAPMQGQPTATATGPNGQKIGLINGQWVPI